MLRFTTAVIALGILLCSASGIMASVAAGTEMRTLSVPAAITWYQGPEYGKAAEAKGLPRTVVVLTEEEAAEPVKSSDNNALGYAVLEVSGSAQDFVLLQLTPGATKAGAVVANADGTVNASPDTVTTQPLTRAAQVRGWEQIGAPLLAPRSRFVWAVGISAGKVKEDEATTSDEERLLFVGAAYQLNPYISLVGGVTLSDWDTAYGVSLDARILNRLGLSGLVRLLGEE